MPEMVNPYIAGAPVVETRMFFGREDVFEWIQNSLTGRYSDHTLVIHGQRRVGKTSVLKQLGNRLPQKYIPVFFDLQGRTHTTLDHFLWWLAREIVRVLKQERDITFPAPEKEAFTRDIEYFEHRFLPDLRTVLGENALLLTFDEFDNLEESEIKEELAIPLIDYLRRLMGQEGLNFIFSIGSSGRKLENMQAAYTDFFKTALYKKISFLNEEQTRNLVTRPVAGMIEYERTAVERIYSIASGHPYFTQLTCHELFARCQRTEQRRIAVADIESVLDDVIERGTVNLKFVWDDASDIEKWSLAALAQLDKADNRTLADFLRKNRVRFSESDLTSGLLHLREKDVLTPQNRFIIHLLRIWLQKNRPIEQAREELTEANPIANRFIEIGLEFRDGGQYEKAIDFFRQSLSVSPENIQAQVNIALTYAAQGKLEQAITEFEKALSIDDEDVASRSGLCDAHLALGDAAMKKGRAKEALLSYQRVLAINAEHLEARQRMAELSLQRAEKALSDGKDEEALSAFAEALKFTPEDGALIARSEKVRAEKNAKVLAGQVARSEKEAGAHNWDKAIAALNDALEIAPGDESILKKIKAIQEKQLQGRLDAILAKVEAAEKVNRWDTAIAALNEYLQLKPDDTAIQKRLADMLEAKHASWLTATLARVDQAAAAQNWDEALTTLNEALRLEPDNAEMQAKAVQVHAARRSAELNLMLKRADQAASAGRWDEAITVLNDGLASDPGNETLNTKLAEARKAKREARLQAALRLADNAAQAGKWETAVASLNEVLANEPDNAEFQKKLAEVRLQEHASLWDTARLQAEGLRDAEQFEQALQAWQAYLSLHPEDSQRVEEEIKQVTQVRELLDLYTNAGAAIASKDFDGAIRLLKDIIIRDENYKDASRLLTKAIESRRTAPKQDKPRQKPERLPKPRTRGEPKTGGRRIWIGGLLAILILGIGGGLFWLGKNYLPAISGLFTNSTVLPTPTGNTIIVTSADDSGVGTLRQALLDAQAGDTITFDPEIFPPDEPTTIFPTSVPQINASLPRISQGGITIDASNAGVILDGSKLQGDSLLGLVINSDHNTVMGLQVINFNGVGIYLEGGSYNKIGGDRSIGTGPFGQGNLTSNNFIGIELLSTSGGNVITGNLIGTDASGAGPMGNWKAGIMITDLLSYHPVPNTIGPDNVIAYNGTTESVQGGEITGGVVIDTGLIPTTITANSIYNNTGPGIVYNINDADQIKYSTPPVILYFDLESGVVNGQTYNDCIVEIFSTDTQDGKIYEGTVTADEFGNFSFSAGRALSGPYLTATAWGPGNSTSEFSQPTPARSAIQIALDAIQSEAPLYQTGFDTWDFGDPVEHAAIENGKLILTSADENGAHLGLIEYPSDRYVVEYEISLVGDAFSNEVCFYGAGNGVPPGTSFRGFTTEFLPGEDLAVLARYVHQSGVDERIVTAPFDKTRSNMVTLVVLGDRITAFINGELAYTAQNPAGSVVYVSHGFAAYNQATCEFDYFRYWDLSGVDFSASETTAPILAYIAGASPDFEDDFSNPNDGWDPLSEDIQTADLIGDGVLQLSLEAGTQTEKIGLYSPNMKASSFGLEFDFYLEGSTGGVSSIIVGFPSTGDGSETNCDVFINLESQTWSIGLSDLSTGTSGIINESLQGRWGHLQVIYYGGQVTAFLDGEPLGHVEHIAKSDEQIWIIATTISGQAQVWLDNVKFWNLDGVDFSATTTSSSTPTPQPTWVTDFAEPILNAIAGRTPDVEEGFDGYSLHDWVIATCQPSGSITYVEEMVVSKCDFSWTKWYTDFVIEMDYRFLTPNDSWTIYFRGFQGFGFSYNNGGVLASDQGTPLSFAILPEESVNHVLIIVEEQAVALFVNDQSIYYGNLDPGWKSGDVEWTVRDSTVAFDNFKIWNLNLP